MNVIGDLVARERRYKEPFVYSTASQPYTAHKFCTDAWKAASLFRYHGLGPGRQVAIADDLRPQALLGFLAGALLGAEVRFGDPTAGDARLALGPADSFADCEPAPGTKRILYGDQPEDPNVIHFERDVWSENPTMPPDRVDPDADVLVTDDDRYTHAELLSATDRVVADADLSADDEIAVESSLTQPGTLVAGVLAPLWVQGTILLPGTDRAGTVTVTDGESSVGRVIRPTDAAP